MCCLFVSTNLVALIFYVVANACTFFVLIMGILTDCLTVFLHFDRRV